ncbi:DUF523 and DUF1722 domain-containing protein [Aliikangiella sp. G2MR2-5]|uniref:YbgA family protein n=1 Tax=Aliikangiella sp. G2MR2-5 TaxID=2788943 RepID=UPI0018AC0139|nr:DUF523 and DUF1722 domain-containing protein [Aliikangiella sp. G2MR2-5]
MIKVGISSCLLGNPVRYDGGHRNNRFCKESLSQFFQFVSLCPEVGIGLPTPRKTIRLVGDVDSPRAVLSDGGDEDFTTELRQFAESHKKTLESLSGYILCKASPSCGMERVKVYNDSGQAEKKGMGIFAARLQTLLPHLPLEEDGRLNDPLIRDSFIKRVFIYNEWKSLQDSGRDDSEIGSESGKNGQGLTTRKLHEFHARHKFTLLAHNQPIYRKVGPLLASVNKQNIDAISEEYITLLMLGLKKVATRKNNTNVLMHLQGYLKDKLSAEDKAELTQCIHDYRDGLQPILGVLTLLKHHFRKFPEPYIDNQSFLAPYPKDLAIRVDTH